MQKLTLQEIRKIAIENKYNYKGANEIKITESALKCDRITIARKRAEKLKRLI